MNFSCTNSICLSVLPIEVWSLYEQIGQPKFMVKQLSLRQLSFDMLFTSQETVVFSKYFGRLTQLSVGRLTSLQAYQCHVTQAGEGFVGTPV